MRKTIFHRYFIRSVILLTASMLALSAAFVVGASRILGQQQLTRMESAARRMQDYLVPFLTLSGELNFDVRSEELVDILPIMADVGDMRILVSDLNGFMRVDSASSLTGHILPEEVAASLLGYTEFTMIPAHIIRDAIPEASLAIAIPLDVRMIGEVTTIGHIIVSSDQTGTRLLMREFLRNWSLMSIVVVLLAGVTAYISARRQVRPLRQMASCAYSLTHGDFTARADVEELQDGEIHDLAKAFNGMAETLERGEELRRGFIANVSHELKTPMTTISGYIGGILDGTVPDERREETLQIVRDEVMRLSRLVESTANLTRLQTGQLELHPCPLDISELSLRVLLGFEGRIEGKGLTVRVDVPETLFVQADPDSITQVLTNLLDNAVKFSTHGGELSLSVRSHAGKAYVSVANEGVAIPPDDLPYVFDRFYKADRSRSRDRTGLGLGLFLVKSIINAHNEDITTTSADGRTEFTFTLTECKKP
ncbi:MAG: HAMP domain-containing protein [Oscillospiraceae bacterium]|jgi:signal transduction histidine kinase|nr:HAMP domain-containing protein [Oscillospiraceae bacterium]